jgi:hypothetical protein
VTCRGGIWHERTFDILIDGEQFATQCFTGIKPVSSLTRD